MSAGLARDIDDLRNALARSRRAATAGMDVDLAGFDREVAKLVEHARCAPPAERPAILAALLSLSGELDRYASDLRSRRAALPVRCGPFAASEIAE